MSAGGGPADPLLPGPHPSSSSLLTITGLTLTYDSVCIVHVSGGGPLDPLLPGSHPPPPPTYDRTDSCSSLTLTYDSLCVYRAWYQAVDPLTLSYLARIHLGGHNDDRVQYIDDSVPRTFSHPEEDGRPTTMQVRGLLGHQ